MKLIDKDLRWSFLIIISMLFIIGCSGDNQTQTTSANYSTGNQGYRVKVFLGYPEDIPKNTEKKAIINELIKIDQPFTFTSPDNNKSIIGKLSKLADGTLHFKGTVQVFTTSSKYDEDITLSEDIMQSGACFSSTIHSFYIKFEKI